jgi:glycosyltransferase involved in cell wall biosynthesis
VESALGQTCGALEVVVIDDGSTDTTPAVLARFGDRIRVVRTPRGGLRRARARGHEEATGEFLAWMDADDLALPDRIEVQLAVMARSSNTVVVSSDFTSFDEAGTLPLDLRSYYGRLHPPGAVEQIYGWETPVEVASRRWPVRTASVRDELPFGNFIHPPTVMIRRDALRDTRLPETDLPISDDWLVLVGLAEAGDFALVDAPLLSYRRSPQQISSPANDLANARDGLRAAEFVFGHLPGLIERFPERVRHTLGERHATVASALAEDSTYDSFGHLLKSIGYSGLSSQHMTTAAKAIAPRALLRAFRWAKARL